MVTQLATRGTAQRGRTSVPRRNPPGPRLPIWQYSAAGAVLLVVLGLAGVVPATPLTAALGTLTLVGSLLPSNLRRIPRFRASQRLKRLAGLRRQLGISSGIWFVAHSVVAIGGLLEPGSAVLPQLATADVIAGSAATGVFVALLLTSNARAQRALGKNWKRLQRLVWFSLPLALTHTVLANLRFEGQVNPLFVALLAGPVVLAGVEATSSRRRRWTHLALIGAGAAAAALISVLSPATPV